MDASRLQPRVVTWNDLLAALLPYIKAYPWAIAALRDLWKMGAPTPDSGPGVPEKRVLLPRQFQAWWEEVQERMGYPESAAEMWGRIKRA